MNAILKKLHFKAQSPVLVLNAPPELAPLKAAFSVPVHTAIKGSYGFALVFAKSRAEVKAQTRALKKALADTGALLWVAYPKGASKTYSADINRDSLHALMATAGFDGVSLVSLDSDWSAMRFKRAAAE